MELGKQRFVKQAHLEKEEREQTKFQAAWAAAKLVHETRMVVNAFRVWRALRIYAVACRSLHILNSSQLSNECPFLFHRVQIFKKNPRVAEAGARLLFRIRPSDRADVRHGPPADV